MPIILLVEKTGNIKQQKIQDTNLDNLYKKAGFKNNDGGEFCLRTTWNVEGTAVSLYGKTEGKAGMENKYDFPPPVDSTLFFGSCILVGVDAEGKMQDLKLETWTHMYEVLFGGFEDLGDSDSEEEELDTDDEIEMLKGAAKESGMNVVIKKTRDGYINDGFVVDDDEDDDESFVETESSLSEEEDRKKKKRATKKPAVKSVATTAKKVAPKKETAGRKGAKKKVEVEELATNDVYMECTEELEEEDYV